MELIYKSSFKLIWKYFLSVYLKIAVIVFIIIMLFSAYKNMPLDLLTFGLPFLVVSLTHFIPLTILLLNHYFHSRNLIFKIDTKERKCLAIKKNRIYEILFSDIKTIAKYVSPVKYDNRIDYSLFGDIHFWEITTFNNECFRFSCLLIQSDKIFSFKNYSEKKIILPFIKSFHSLICP